MPGVPVSHLLRTTVPNAARSAVCISSRGSFQPCSRLQDPVEMGLPTLAQARILQSAWSSAFLSSSPSVPCSPPRPCWVAPPSCSEHQSLLFHPLRCPARGLPKSLCRILQEFQWRPDRRRQPAVDHQHFLVLPSQMPRTKQFRQTDLHSPLVLGARF